MKKFSIILILAIAAIVACKSAGGSKKGLEYKVDLNELPTSADSKIVQYFNLASVDRSGNKLLLKKESLKPFVERIINVGLLNPSINEHSFYKNQNHPKLCYWEYIIQQLPESVKYGYKYDAYSDNFGEDGQFFATLIYRVDRSPESIRSLWSLAKPIVFATIDRETYQQKHLETYIKTLKKVYIHLKALPDYQEKMKAISTEVKEEDTMDHIWGRAPHQYPLYKDILLADVIEEFEDERGYSDYDQYTDVLWFHSFWMRRWREGNSDVVYSILEEIEKNYAK